MKKFRNNGAIGALLDEYEKALLELKTILNTVTPKELIAIADPQTSDPDCHSIQTILTHVVRSGYCYVIEIRNWLGEKIEKVERIKLNSIAEYQRALTDMFQYNVQLFNDYPNIRLEETANEKKITVGWGQTYDAEQLIEHAICHILRHRRQIERFLILLRK